MKPLHILFLALTASLIVYFTSQAGKKPLSSIPSQSEPATIISQEKSFATEVAPSEKELMSQECSDCGSCCQVVYEKSKSISAQTPDVCVSTIVTQVAGQAVPTEMIADLARSVCQEKKDATACQKQWCK